MPQLRIVFKQANPEFNQSYADEYCEGKESPGNDKYLFSRTHFIQVGSYELMKNIDYSYSGKTDKGVELNLLIKNMHVLKFTLSSGEIGEIVVSKNLIQKILRGGKRDENTANYYFYFNERTDFKKIDDYMFLLNEDIPHEIKKYIF